MKLGSKRASERTDGRGTGKIRVSKERKSLVERHEEWRVPPTSEPSTSRLGTRDHLGLICRTETLRFFSAHIPLAFPASRFSSLPHEFYLFRALFPSPPINHKNPMALFCSSSFHLLSIQTRETLTNTLPMIYSTVSEERRVCSSIDRSLPHSLPILILLSSLSVHLVGSSLLVVFDRGKRGERWKCR